MAYGEPPRRRGRTALRILSVVLLLLVLGAGVGVAAYVVQAGDSSDAATTAPRATTGPVDAAGRHEHHGQADDAGGRRAEAGQDRGGLELRPRGRRLRAPGSRAARDRRGRDHRLDDRELQELGQRPRGQAGRRPRARRGAGRDGAQAGAHDARARLAGAHLLDEGRGDPRRDHRLDGDLVAVHDERDVAHDRARRRAARASS